MTTGLNPRSYEFFVSKVLDEFFDRADEDYISARVLFLHNLHASFFWTAQQTLEKYLKAALLLRGIEIEVTHDLKWLFNKLRSAGDVDFPSVLSAPKKMPKLPEQYDMRGRLRPWSFNQELSQFVSKISHMGGTNSRYNETDLELEPYDIVRFDLTAMLFRNAAIHSPKLLLHREVTEKSHGTIQFGRIRVREETLDKLKYHNHAYWPDEDHGEMFFSFRFKNNEGKRKIYKDDPDYRSAKQFFDRLRGAKRSKSP